MPRRSATQTTAATPPASDPSIDAWLHQAMTEIEAARPHTVPPASGEEDAWSRCLRRDQSSARQRLVAIRDLLPAIERRDLQAAATAATLAIEVAHTAGTVVRSDVFAELARRLHSRWQGLYQTEIRASIHQTPPSA